ncbi:hypothetical protein G6011_06206 [Alternaria panax]|uniref:Uncharacterized protein n=1 Tax=Alternaria panax TaxID=48097 RepID=A0AAD4FG34_9PLEO|nr:hypothetical protein G6011_06206 [Alternaria panax]
MSYRNVDDRKRPPPIAILNPLPPPRPPPGAAPTNQQSQKHSRNASNSTKGRLSTGNTPLFSPVESHPPASGSSRSRNAMATFTNLIDQARVSSPRKLKHASWTGSNVDSTARSRQSGRSQHDAAAAQARLEALDEETARGKMESRAEKNIFKLTGQIPPTPTADSADEDDVYIRTQDLRQQCRITNGEQQPDYDEPPKSPKRKLFQNLRNTFSKSSGAAPPPVMPNKAAQILGIAARQAHVIPVWPIKPAHPKETAPTRVSRSNTANSLPAKMVNPDSYARRYRSGISRRNRSSGRSSSGRGGLRKQSSDIENTPPAPEFNAALDSLKPPPPPAKDTPPPGQRPASPLRRAVPAGNLRDNYSTFTDGIETVRFPDFDLSPSPSTGTLPEDGGKSPTKFIPYTAEDYSKLIGGEAMQWSYPDCNGSPSKADGKHPTPLAGANLSVLRLPHPDRRSEERPNATPPGDNNNNNNNNNANTYSPLHPCFYSPTHLSARGFAEGETPSKNSDTTRLLYSLPGRSLSLLYLREQSDDGSIKMIFQGDRQDVDPNSPTAHEWNENEQRNQTGDRRPDVGITTRDVQELRIGEKNGDSAQKNGNPVQVQPNQYSSRFTDMLKTVGPGRSESHGDIQPYCASAVPSPLHRVACSQISACSVMPSGGSYGAFPPLFPPKTIDDHFFMTNEHLDVVGKTTWDLLDTLEKQHKSTSRARQEETLALINTRFEQISSQITTLDDNAKRIDKCLDRANGIVDNQQNIYASINSVSDCVKETIPKTLVEQDKKMTGMEAEMKEMRQIIQALQKSVEQKATEAKAVQQSTPPGQGNTANIPQPPFPTHNSRSQHSLPSYYGANTEVIRDGHAVMPHSMASPQDSHSDPRFGCQANNQWTTRAAYTSRNPKEERPPYLANPYHNMGGQYNNSYDGTYSSYAYSPDSLSPPDQHFAFNNQGNQGQAK